MPSNEVLMYIMGGSVLVLIAIVIAYVLINKALNKGDRKYVRKLRQGTKTNKFSSEVLYQKLYNCCFKKERGYLHDLHGNFESGP